MRACLLFAVLLSMSISAQVPLYESYQYVSADDAYISIPGGHASPLVTDWDNDGDKDLILGRFNYGLLMYFQNEGTNELPVLTFSGFMEADGEVISLPWGSGEGVGGATNPQAVDWNDDGYDDLIVGDWMGCINYFQRNPDGTLQANQKLKNGVFTLDAGGNSAPDFIDWDNDGDLDMLVGNDNSNSHIRYYENKGTASEYQFNGYGYFYAGGDIVDLDETIPSFCDMNGDGLFDLVIGAADSKFHYFENTGTTGSPVFAADAPLEYLSGGHVITDNYRSMVDVCDWNEDGYPDLIAGDQSSKVYLFLATDLSGVGENPSGQNFPGIFSMIDNPVSDNLSLSINLELQSNPCFTIYTVDGRRVSSYNAGTLNPGPNVVDIPIQLPSGAYLIQYTEASRTLTDRFIVIR